MFMALLRNGGFGFGGDGAGTATQGIETQAQLNAIRTQLQDNQNADCIKSAIQGNGFALSQLAQTLNIDFNTLQKCCCQTQRQIADSALTCYFRTVKTRLRFAMANAILVLQLHKVSQLLLSRLSKISAIFFVPVKTTLSASLIL